MFFKGSGKECRLNVQKLNELRGNNDQNYEFSNNDNDQLSDTVEGTPTESIQNEWDDFFESSDENNDSSCLEGVSESSTLQNIFEGASFKDINPTKYNIQKNKRIDHSMSMSNDVINNKEIDFSHWTKEYDDPLTSHVEKKRKVDTASTESEWTQYLPDEYSDESN